MKIDSRRLRWILMGSLVLSVLAFILITYFGLTVLSKKSKQIVDLKIQSETANAQLTDLAIAKKQVQKYSYFKDVAREVIPNDKDQAQAVLDIFQMADAAGISIQNVTFPASTLGLKTTTLSTSDTADATAKSSSAKAITQAKPFEGISGLYSLTLTITPETGVKVPKDKQVTYGKILNFLSRIEKNRRTAQITEVIIQPATDNSSLSFTLTINIFIKP